MVRQFYFCLIIYDVVFILFFLSKKRFNKINLYGFRERRIQRQFKSDETILTRSDKNVPLVAVFLFCFPLAVFGLLYFAYPRVGDGDLIAVLCVVLSIMVVLIHIRESLDECILTNKYMYIYSGSLVNIFYASKVEIKGAVVEGDFFNLVIQTPSKRYTIRHMRNWFDYKDALEKIDMEDG